jgi:hypothetical protein
VIYGYNKLTATGSRSPTISPYDKGTAGCQPRGALTGNVQVHLALVKDAVETLATKNVPRLGETYVSFVHPHQSPLAA